MTHYITETCDQCGKTECHVRPLMLHCEDCDLTLCPDCNIIKDECNTEIEERIGPCGNCDKMICDDDAFYCNDCGQRNCSDCARHCEECGENYCALHWSFSTDTCLACADFYRESMGDFD
ncbi:hypothetical protein [Bifidobacterium sp. SO1]|uniref:hypothetical protein n=1 Tax=Bifidobacterium sp. SO1 TaxID=2809029 RepID=UPI001BDBC325|nr:hypothetical protein [Bifidobacterium sp. SO1]MBT1162215.1 hypothetical protein [Bifidobacterium sp. SO1]